MRRRRHPPPSTPAPPTGASLTAGDDVSLDATSNDTAMAQAIGAGLGVVGVGISIATATDGGSTDAHSDANVNLTGGNDVSITASGVDDATADSTAASGGIVSGDGADGTATIDPRSPPPPATAARSTRSTRSPSSRA